MSAIDELNASMEEAERVDVCEHERSRVVEIIKGSEKHCASNPQKRLPVLIDGILRMEHKGIITCSGKSGKTFLALQLAACVATGSPWLGHKCKQGKVLFIDPELDYRSAHNRMHDVCDALGFDKDAVDSCLDWVHLRGKECDIDILADELCAQVERGTYVLIVVDSLYKIFTGNENSSQDVNHFWAKIDRITRVCGSAVFLTHHTGKGAKGDIAAIERGRGSSVWTDAPDAVLTLSETFPKEGEPGDYLENGEVACLLESGGLRSFGRMEPVRLIFKYPNPEADQQPAPPHRIDVDGITDGWRPRSSYEESRRNGGKTTGKLNRAKSEVNAMKVVCDLLAYFYEHNIGEDGLLFSEALKIVDVSDKTLSKMIENCEHFYIHKESRRKRYVRPIRLARSAFSPYTRCQ